MEALYFSKKSCMGNPIYFDTICIGHVQTLSINELELDSWALQYLYLYIYLSIYLP